MPNFLSQDFQKNIQIYRLICQAKHQLRLLDEIIRTFDDPFGPRLSKDHQAKIESLRGSLKKSLAVKDLQNLTKIIQEIDLFIESDANQTLEMLLKSLPS